MHKNLETSSGGVPVILRGRAPAKVLGAMLLLIALYSTAPAASAAVSNSDSLAIGWDASTDPGVTGYRVYYGTASGNYSSSLAVGNATSVTVSNLTDGVTYFLTVVALDTNGLESPFAGEISFVLDVPALQLQTTATGQANLTVSGGIGHTYEIQATQDFKTWSVLGTVFLDGSGPATFNDTSAAGLSKRFYRTHQIAP